MYLSFGKFNGTKIDDVPDYYLKFLCGKFNKNKEELVSAFEWIEINESWIIDYAKKTLEERKNRNELPRFRNF